MVRKSPKNQGNVRRIGRPKKQSSIYSDIVANEIIDRLSAGESLRAICNSPNMPDRGVVMVWERENPDFSAKCRRARELGIDARLDSLDEVIDDLKAGRIDANAAKVIISKEQWFASKLVPKLYGDKVQADVSGSISLIDLVNHAMAKRRERMEIDIEPLEPSVPNGQLAPPKPQEDQ